MFYDMDKEDQKEKLTDFIERLGAHIKTLDQANLSEH